VTFTFHHAALSVRDLSASMAFYGHLGFAEVYRYDAPDKSVVIVHMALAGAILELFCFSDAEMPSHQTTMGNDLSTVGIKHIGLRVESIRATRDALRTAGLVKDPEIKLGRTGIEYFFLQDPDGLWVEVVQDDRALRG
jgi:catechol 2,3-dioxygenase-like lactoylglutathione lyase family enzyme